MTGVMEALKQKPSVAPLPTVRHNPFYSNLYAASLLSLFNETVTDFTIGGTR